MTILSAIRHTSLLRRTVRGAATLALCAGLSGCGWLGLADAPGGAPTTEKPAAAGDAPRYEAAPLPNAAFFQ